MPVFRADGPGRRECAQCSLGEPCRRSGDAAIDRGKAASQIDSVICVACQLWIVSLWAAFVAFWMIAGVFTKRRLDCRALRRGIAAGAALFAVVLAAAAVLVRHAADVGALLLLRVQSEWMAAAGAALATLGAMLAFAARAEIGRNWGIPRNAPDRHGAGDQRTLQARSSSDLQPHLIDDSWDCDRTGSGLVARDRCRGHLLRRKCPRRRGLHGQAFPGRLSGLPGTHEDADPFPAVKSGPTEL